MGAAARPPARLAPTLPGEEVEQRRGRAGHGSPAENKRIILPSECGSQMLKGGGLTAKGARHESKRFLKGAFIPAKERKSLSCCIMRFI